MEFRRRTKKLSGLPIAFYVVALLFFVLLFSFNSLYYKASEQPKPVVVETQKKQVAKNEAKKKQLLSLTKEQEKAYQEVLDRLEGKPKQSTELEVSGGLSVVWEEKKTYVGNNPSI